VKPGLPLLDEIVGRALAFRHDVRTWIDSGRVVAITVGDNDSLISARHPHCCISSGRELPPPMTWRCPLCTQALALALTPIEEDTP
jgi:hypothetical protein